MPSADTAREFAAQVEGCVSGRAHCAADAMFGKLHVKNQGSRQAIPTDAPHGPTHLAPAAETIRTPAPHGAGGRGERHDAIAVAHPQVAPRAEAEAGARVPLRHWATLWSERTNIKYDRNRMQRRCSRDAFTVKVHQWMKSQGCTAVWLGTGACKARGHKPIPTKSMMRGLERHIPVVAGNECGTSSRCPSCRDGTKLQRARSEDSSASPSHTHSMEVEGTDVPVEDMLASQPESHRKHSPAHPLPRPRPLDDKSCKSTLVGDRPSRIAIRFQGTAAHRPHRQPFVPFPYHTPMLRNPPPRRRSHTSRMPQLSSRSSMSHAPVPFHCKRSPSP